MSADGLLPDERKVLEELGHLSLDFRAIASRNCRAPWARNASHAFSARKGREYSSVLSAACNSCR